MTSPGHARRRPVHGHTPPLGGEKRGEGDGCGTAAHQASDEFATARQTEDRATSRPFRQAYDRGRKPAWGISPAGGTGAGAGRTGDPRKSPHNPFPAFRTDKAGGGVRRDRPAVAAGRSGAQAGTASARIGGKWRPEIGPRLFGYLWTPSMALADGQGLRLQEDQRARECGAERQRLEEEHRQERSRGGWMKIQPCRAIRNRTRRAAIARQGGMNGGISMSQTGRHNAAVRRVSRHGKVANGGCCFREALPAMIRSVRYELVNGVPG